MAPGLDRRAESWSSAWPRLPAGDVEAEQEAGQARQLRLKCRGLEGSLVLGTVSNPVRVAGVWAYVTGWRRRWRGRRGSDREGVFQEPWNQPFKRLASSSVPWENTFDPKHLFCPSCRVFVTPWFHNPALLRLDATCPLRFMGQKLGPQGGDFKRWGNL